MLCEAAKGAGDPARRDCDHRRRRKDDAYGMPRGRTVRAGTRDRVYDDAYLSRTEYALPRFAV